MAGPLKGVRVLDLTRILAGPTATQLLGDLGADVVKVEHPIRGDETRTWGPPFLAHAPGDPPRSTYFACANRNKRSIALDLADPEHARIARSLAERADVLVENFKLGSLAKLGLDYAALAPTCPRLVYCSITGFGHTGPRAHGVGYDLLAQALGGMMSLTGEPDGAPMKVGVGAADIVCGLYAGIAVLAALRARDATGAGQHIDLSLLDTQIAWLVNEGVAYLASGDLPKRRGNAHPSIVPYELFETADGHVVLAIGNDGQFGRFCAVAGLVGLERDPRFATNAARMAHREELLPAIRAAMKQRTSESWARELELAKVPCGPVRTLDGVFADPQVVARQMRVDVADPHAPSGTVALLGNPIRFSATPIEHRHAPPALGEHTDEVLRDWLGP